MLRALGHLWAAPLTLAGLAVGIVCGGRIARFHRGAIDLVAPARGPLAFFFHRFGVHAFTWGAAIVYRDDRLLGDLRLCLHERVHVKQCLVLGPLMVIAYPLASLWQTLRGGRAYRDNWFERQARRGETTSERPR